MTKEKILQAVRDAGYTAAGFTENPERKLRPRVGISGGVKLPPIPATTDLWAEPATLLGEDKNFKLLGVAAALSLPFADLITFNNQVILRGIDLADDEAVELKEAKE